MGGENEDRGSIVHLARRGPGISRDIMDGLSMVSMPRCRTADALLHPTYIMMDA